MIEKRQKDGSITYTGYCIGLLNELARNLKFTYEIYPSPDGLYGTETENGTWNGMIGELINKVTWTFTLDPALDSKQELFVVKCNYSDRKFPIQIRFWEVKNYKRLLTYLSSSVPTVTPL